MAGYAGGGAGEQAARAGDRVEQLRRQLATAEQQHRAWAAGATGELMVATALEPLAARGWRRADDVHWPGRPQANLDHVLVGPGGILVIDAKNWSGAVTIRDGMLQQNGYRRTRETSAVNEQAAAVAALLEPAHRKLVRGWICMAWDATVDETTGDGVRVLSLATVSAAVAGLPAVLDAGTVTMIDGYLRRMLAGAISPPLLTTSAIAESTRRPPAPARPAPTRRAPTRASRPVPGHSTRNLPQRTHPAPPPAVVLSDALRQLGGLGLRVLLVLIGLSIVMGMLQRAGSALTPPAPSPTKPTATSAPASRN